ncbi:hypothetical protein [Streptomyces sp. NPDC001056]
MDDSDEERIRRAVRRGVQDAQGSGCGCGCLIFLILLIFSLWSAAHQGP